MAEMLERIFVKPDTLPGGASCESAEEGYCELAGYGLVQVLGLAAAYAYVLFFASNLISDGAELLQMVPSLEHLVGSVVLPVLGAVPDGAIILFSGLAGDRALAQQQLSIGVGALAGSTIMLLSLPWALSVYAGRVNLDEHGIGSYKRPPGWRASERGPFAKLSPPTNASLRGTGVNCDAVVGHSAWVMVGTAALYLIAQLPAMTRNYRASSAPTTDEEALAVARFEKPFAIAGLAACSLCFVGYLAHKTFSGEAEAMRVMVLEEKRIQLIRSGHLTLVGAMGHLVSKLEASAASAGADGADGGGADAAVAAAVAARAAPRPFTRSGTSLRDELLAPLHGSAGSRAGAQHAAVPAPAQRRLSLSGQHAEILDEIRYTLRPFFHRYDSDGSKTIDAAELRVLFADMHESVGAKELADFATGTASADLGADGVSISFDEFVQMVISYIRRRGSALRSHTHTAAFTETDAELRSAEAAEAAEGGGADAQPAGADGAEAEEDEDDEDEEEVPDELKDLPPEEQHKRALRSALRSMALGSVLVVLFSDPMVGVLGEMAARTGVPPFYVAFVLAPLASNGSEVVSAFAFSRRKTVRSVTISFSSLLGAAIMNNTFCLAIFMALIVFRGDLYWEFTAETAAVIVVELALAVIAVRRTHRLLDGVLVGALYPLGIAVVCGLEAAGFD